MCYRLASCKQTCANIYYLYINICIYKLKIRLTFYSHDFPKTPLMYNTSDKYYTAALPDLECENSGNYTIEVDNGIKDSVKKNINLVVECKLYIF
jgi:hypothetical protein